MTEGYDGVTSSSEVVPTFTEMTETGLTEWWLPTRNDNKRRKKGEKGKVEGLNQ